MDNAPNISRKINNKSNSIYQIPATFKQISLGIVPFRNHLFVEKEASDIEAAVNVALLPFNTKTGEI